MAGYNSSCEIHVLILFVTMDLPVTKSLFIYFFQTRQIYLGFHDIKIIFVKIMGKKVLVFMYANNP